jgi:hypothetical protein
MVFLSALLSIVQCSQCIFKPQEFFLDTCYCQSFSMLAISNYSVRLPLNIMCNLVHLCFSSNIFLPLNHLMSLT